MAETAFGPAAGGYAVRSVLDPQALAGHRILVTGGSGFIGSNLVDFFLASGARSIVNFDIVEPRNSARRTLWRKVDLCERDALIAAVKEFAPTAVFHMGARTDLHGASLSDYAANVEGVVNIIDALLGVDPVPPVVFASSRLVCRIGYQPRSETDYLPTTVYGESKIETERVVRAHAGDRLRWVLVRPTSIWGPWFEIPYRTFFDTVRRGLYVHPAGRTVRKSFGFVGNTVYQLDRLLFSSLDGVRGKTIYLCDYEPLDVAGWAELIARGFNRRPPFQVPYPLLNLVAKVGDMAESAKLAANAPITSFRLDNLVTEMIYDTTPLATAVGPTPFSVEDGVRITVDWMLRNETTPAPDYGVAWNGSAGAS